MTGDEEMWKALLLLISNQGLMIEAMTLLEDRLRVLEAMHETRIECHNQGTDTLQ